jgi:hypothetical protein
MVALAATLGHLGESFAGSWWFAKGPQLPQHGDRAILAIILGALLGMGSG